MTQKAAQGIGSLGLSLLTSKVEFRAELAHCDNNDSHKQSTKILSYMLSHYSKHYYMINRALEPLVSLTVTTAIGEPRKRSILNFFCFLKVDFRVTSQEAKRIVFITLFFFLINVIKFLANTRRNSYFLSEPIR